MFYHTHQRPSYVRASWFPVTSGYLLGGADLCCPSVTWNRKSGSDSRKTQTKGLAPDLSHLRSFLTFSVIAATFVGSEGGCLHVSDHDREVSRCNTSTSSSHRTSRLHMSIYRRVRPLHRRWLVELVVLSTQLTAAVSREHILMGDN